MEALCWVKPRLHSVRATARRTNRKSAGQGFIFFGSSVKQEDGSSPDGNGEFLPALHSSRRRPHS